jgi:hypothetical protein
MGKALIIAGTVVVVTIAVIILIGWLRRQATKEKAAEKGWAIKGDLNKAQEQRLKADLDTAAEIMRQIATPAATLFDEASLLTSAHRADVEAWLRIYNERRKETR